MNTSEMRKLMVVDDTAIRKSAFSRLDRLVKKLQKMENGVAAFYERDLRLFEEWYELTFRDRRHRIEAKRDRYLALARFHNLMLALAEMEDLSLPEALKRLREEERLLRDGTPDQKRHIENLHRLREEYVRTEYERRERKREERQSRQSELDDARSGPRAPDVADIEEMEVISSMEDSEIEEWVADSDIAFMVLSDSLRVANFTGNFALFVRIWDLVHPKIQSRFARDFQRQAGASITAAIEKLRAKLNGEEAPPTREETPEAIETFKLIYRQIVRKLHPDMNLVDEKTGDREWRAKMWLRVQAAYKDENERELSKLFHLVLLRSRELNSLRVSDLHLTHEWLEDEISTTADQIKGLRRKPAWGFSRRKDFAPIMRKLSQELNKQEHGITAQIEELELQHIHLERLMRGY